MLCYKKLIFIAFVLLGGVAVHAQKPIKLILFNPTSVMRNDELLVITRKKLEEKAGIIPNNKFVVAEDRNHQQVIVQHDDKNRDGLWDEIVLLQSFKASEKKVFTISFSDSPIDIQTEMRAHVRHRRKDADNSFGGPIDIDSIPAGQAATDFSKEVLPPFLTEGPAWENDKVGFRIYFDVRNTKDIWGKTTSKMVLDEVGSDHTNSYHQLSWWGMDILKVGKSLGAGSLALRIKEGNAKDTLVRLGGLNMGKVIYEKVSDGPLRAVFRLHYPNWTLLEGLPPANLTEEISIWGGQYFYQSKVMINDAPVNAQLVCGFANFESKGSHQLNTSSYTILYSFDRQSENKDQLGMAILMNRENFSSAGKTSAENTDIQNSYTVSSSMRSQQPVVFRFYAGWEKSTSRFRSENGFKTYLLQQASQLQRPINVSIK